MRKDIPAAIAAFALTFQLGWAGPACEKPADAMAIKAAALQQEMMVAALACKAVGAYNEFVVSHQKALQASDRTLMAFFVTANPRGGFDDYNLYKTELANAASLRAIRDLLFCARAAAYFEAAQGLPLEQVVNRLPHPVDTGAVQCRVPETAEPPMQTAATVPRR